MELKSDDLEKICRLCLTIKKDMRNMFTENIISMLEEFCNLKVRFEFVYSAYYICNLNSILLF